MHAEQLKLLIKSIVQGNFVQKISSFDELILALGQHQELPELPNQKFRQFIKENKAVESLFKDNLHHMAYIDRLLRTMIILLERGLVDKDVLDIIWDQQLDKHDAILRNVILLISKMALRFSDELFDTLFKKLEKSRTDGDEKIQDLALDLMRRLGTELRTLPVGDKSNIVREIVQILWRWTCDASDGFRDKVYNVILEIFHECPAPQTRDVSLLEDQVMQIAACCLDPHYNRVDDSSVASSLILLKRLICLVPEETIFEDHNRQELILKLDARFGHDDMLCKNTIFTFGKKIAENICDWIAQVSPKVRDAPDDAMDTDSSSCESDDPDDFIVLNLRKRLEFLHFIIIEGRRVYKKHFNLFKCHWMPTLWRRMIEGTSHTFQTIGFRFFRDVVVIVLDNFDPVSYEAHRSFFYDCVLSVPTRNLTQSGFKCFSTYLKFVNISRGILQYNSSLELDDDQQLLILHDSSFEGEDYLCRVIMTSQDAVQKDASHLLERMYSSYIKLKSSEESDKIIVHKCVNWVFEVDNLRRTMEKEESDRTMKNVLQSILEVVEKTENDVKLVVRERPTLRRSIALHGFRSELSFKFEDIQALFPTTLVPKHFHDPWGICLNDNMLLFEVIQTACRMLNNQGAEVTPYPMTIHKRIFSHHKPIKLHQTDWGSTMKELGITEGASLIARLDRNKMAIHPEMDRMYQDIVNLNRCHRKEKNLLSYQLAEHSTFVKKLLELADESELLESSYQLLASIPIKREIGLAFQKDYASLLAAIHNQPSVSIRLYLLFYLFECLMPSTSPETKNNSQALRLFYEAHGLASLLKLFSRLTEATERELEFEMFCGDILFRLVPGLFQIYMNTVGNRCAEEMNYKSWIKLDPFLEGASKMFSTATSLPKVEYDLNILLSIVKAGSKFLSNSNGNLFYSAVLETRCGEEDETLLDEDNDPAEDQADHMVFACVGLLALLSVNNPERSRELLETAEFHKFLVDCCNSDSGNDYVILIPNLFFAVERYLKTDHLIESMVDYMFGQMHNGTSTFWEVLASLIERFYVLRETPLRRIAEYITETIEWLIGVQTEATLSGYGNQHVLSGRLKLGVVLLSHQTDEAKRDLGLPRHSMIERMLFKFLIPSSKELYDMRRKENGIVRLQPTQETSRSNGVSASDPRCILSSRAVAVCTSEESQKQAYRLLVTLASHPDCLSRILATIMSLFYKDREELIPWDYQPNLNLRQPGNFVGLKNGGATCYMNSILQQLYMIPEIRDSLLNVVVPEELKEDDAYQIKIVSALQSVFANLAGSELEAYTPDEFWTIFKMNEQIVNVQEQQDAYEFYNKIVDLIDEGMEKLGAQKIGTNVFGGKFADEKICIDCPHRYTREEPFTSISIDVRSHNNIIDSLNEFVRGDVLENDNAYHCEKCDKKVRAVKRMTIKSLPDNLVVQLKRFEFDWERNEPVKFNDYFEFPFQIDLKPYTTDAMNSKDKPDSETTSIESSQDDYFYRLKGVVVHSGLATGGHYFSYIRSSDNTWHKFDDTDVTIYPCDPQDVKYKWFGEDPNNSMDYHRRKARICWNAFVLFYEKMAPIISMNKTITTPLIVMSEVPLSLPLTVDPNVSSVDISRRSSTASPVTRLHKRFSNMSLRGRPHYIPPKLEAQVREMNTRVMHQRNEFSYSFCEFIYELGSTYAPTISDPFAAKKLTEVVSMFTFYTLVRSAPIYRRDMTKAFNKESMVFLLDRLLHRKSSRVWFINNIVLNETLSRSYLINLSTVSEDAKNIYIKILIHLIDICAEYEDTVIDLQTESTPFLTTLLNKRRSNEPFVVDLLLESLVALFREDSSDDIAQLLSHAYKPRLFGNYLKAGFLPACLRYLELNRYWEVPIFGNMLSLSLTLFGFIDFRSQLSRRIPDAQMVSHLLSSTWIVQTLEPCPYQVESIRLEECLDSQEIIAILFGNASDKMMKYLEIAVFAVVRETWMENFIDFLSCLCWNNFSVTHKLLATIFRFIVMKTTSRAAHQRLLSLTRTIITMNDSVHKSRRILLWILKDYHLPFELFKVSSPGNTFACVPLMRTMENKMRYLDILAIILEAYNSDSGREDDPNLVQFLEREHITDFFSLFWRLFEELKDILGRSPLDGAQQMTLEERLKYEEQVDVLQRILVIDTSGAQEFVDDGSSDDSDNQAMELDEDVAENDEDQPLDLTFGTTTSRSAVTTPMLAEKRNLMPEDSDPPNEAKKSRLSENGEEDQDRLLLNLLASNAAEPIQTSPPHPDDNLA